MSCACEEIILGIAGGFTVVGLLHWIGSFLKWICGRLWGDECERSWSFIDWLLWGNLYD